MESLSSQPEDGTKTAETSTKAMRVLVVEDDFLVSLSVQEAVELAGMEVIGTATTAGQAIMLCETERPDLVTLDLNLCGDLIGLEVAEVLKDQLDVPIVFVTAFSTPEIRQKGDKISPLGWIEKPFTPQVMADQLKEIAVPLH